MERLFLKLLKKIDQILLKHGFYKKLKEKISGLVKEHSRFIKIFILVLCLFYIIAITFYMIHSLRLDVGIPPGYDTVGHVRIIEFVKNNFPNIFWDPYWHNGIISFPSSYPLYHEILGMIGIITRIQGSDLIRYTTILSLLITVLSIFGIAYIVSKRLILALCAPLLLISASAYWAFMVEAGLYLRIAGFAFYLLNTFLLLLYILNKKDTVKKIVYPLIILTFLLSILSHLYTTVFAFLSLTALIYFFGERGERFKLWFKTISISGLLTAFYYLPYYLFHPMKMQLIGNFNDPLYTTPITLDMLFKQAYPGMSAIIFPLAVILLVIITFTSELEDTVSINDERTSGLNSKALKYAFYFFAIIGMAFIIYCLRIFKFSIAALDPQHSLFFVSLFLMLAIIFGVSFLGKEFISKRILFISLAVLSALSLNTVNILKTHRAENMIIKSKDFLTNIDESKSYRFSSYDQNISKQFNLIYDGLQTRGYSVQSVMYPAFNYWFEQILFNNNTAVYETKFILDWYAINNIYLSEKSTGIVRSSPEIKFDKDPDFIRDGKGYLYLKKTPIFYATDARPVFIRGEEEEYEKAVYAIASKNWSINTLIPIKTSSQAEEVIPAKSVVSGIEALGLNPKGYENSGKYLKVIYKNTEHWEVVLKKHYNGLIFKQSYFSNWKAKLIKENGRSSNLRIYMAGPGMMYVLLPEFDGTARVVFEYGHSWPEYLGFLITIGTIIFLISSKIPQIKRLKLNEKVINLIKKEMK